MKTTFLTGVSIAALTLAGAFVANAEESTVEKNSAATVTEAPAAAAPSATEAYATMQSASDWRSSKVVGLNVYNSKAEKIGDINDLIIGSNGAITHAVVGVGGFLGIGEKNVAIPFASVKMSRDKDGKPTAMVDSTKEALQAAPTFKFHTSAS
jgi:sporulation protein YlmC with PRC-barrel domain